ncbi:hypothetical protein LCGC14_0220240 [marine sediment metagenome]|uniref:Uncharacterized protein n=1 Tax=marine sediment metagenome TaxID=412755 RepID=A0A0F9XGW0_9ZZZZ
MLLIINDTDPVSEKHLSWNIKRTVGERSNVLSLYEIVEVTYKHPDADELTIQVIESKLIDSACVLSSKAALWILLEAAFTAISTDRVIA